MQAAHLGDQRAMELILNDTFQTRAEAEEKMHSWKLSSSQLPAYYLGSRERREREKIPAAKGIDFTLDEVHNAALGQGALPTGIYGKDYFAGRDVTRGTS
jgi:uncharacterized protein (DUF885 family)